MSSQLALFVEEKRYQPFAWGSNDCCTFAADWVAMRRKQDPAEPYRGTYHTPLGAARILKARGGVGALADDVGARQPTAWASPGDLVSYDNGRRGESLGVVLDTRAVFPGPQGIVFIPVHHCNHSWRL